MALALPVGELRRELLEQLPLRIEAGSFHRLLQRNPDRVIYFIELRLKLAGAVLHQEEVDELVDERVAGPKVIFDGVELGVISASSPVSSRTSRTAACSGVSCSDTAPLGSPQRVFPRVAIMAT